jgi:ribonuclease-3
VDEEPLGDGHAEDGVAEEGPSHDRRFTVEAWVDGTARGAGSARSKKQAEQRAAREALKALAEPA